MFNFQKYRHIPSPGWTLGWKWAKKEVIWSMVGAQTTEQVQRNITCTYSQFLAQRTPTCCVSLSSFYNKTIVGCPTCTCGCQNNKTESGACLDPDTPHLASVVSPPTKKGTVLPPLVQCTRHLCPIRVHWHVKQNFKE
ncbi:protein COBRA-like isoform X1 [Brassica napus]|uniref:protein COBRA-like isoform X1 n=1 Tax=Brassica napus TaxID=3708 RepID=UPI002078A419|nr:protein COBRA-like isoform X1 [Brassica napus]